MRGDQIEVMIQISRITEARIAGTQLSASAQPTGYTVKLWCAGWGHRRDGSVEIDIRGTLRSPADLLERLP